MTSDVEQRVIQMRFDNAQFERNVHTSMQSLEDLDKTIDKLDGGKAFTDLTKAANKIDLSHLSDQAENVKVSFSAMQVFAVNALNDIYRLTKNFGLKIYGATIGQIKSGGWSRATNIDQAKFQLEGLKVAWKDIYEDIDYSVSGTAYGLDEAARAASQLVASGVKFGETFGETGSSPMAKALRGISGVAAMTNSSFDDMARIFTTVAGQGRLMSMQLNQLAARGLNVAATLGEQLGKSEAQIREMVHKGQIDFATFAEAMDDAFGEHAKDANKTFEGALANMKSALSRIGQLFAAPIRENTIPVFNELRLLFNSVKTAVVPIADDFERVAKALSNFIVAVVKGKNNFSALSNIMYGIRNIFRSLVIHIVYIKRAFEEVFPPLKDFSFQFYELTNHLMPTEQHMEGFKTVIKALITPLKLLFDILKVGVNIISKFAVVLADAINHIGEYLSYFKYLIDPFTQFVKENDILEKVMASIVTVIAVVIASFKKFAEVVIAFIEKVKQSPALLRFVTMLKDIGKTIAGLAAGALAAVVGLFDKLDKKAANTKHVSKLNQALLTLEDTFKRIYKTARKVIDILKIAFVVAIGAVYKAITWYVSGLKTVFGWIKTAFGDIRNSGSFGEGLAKGFEYIKRLVEWFLENLGPLGEKIKDVMQNMNASKIIVYAFSIAIIDLIRRIAKLTTAAGSVLTLFNSFITGTNGIFASFKRLTGVLDRRNMLIGMSLLITTFTIAVAAIGKLKLKQVEKTTKIIAQFMAAATGMLAFLMLVGKFTGANSLSDAAEALTAFGFAIAGFAAAVALLDEVDMYDTEAFFNGVKAAIGFMVTAAGLIILIAKSTDKATMSMWSMLGFAVSLSILLNSFSKVLAMGFDVEEATEFLLGVVAVMGALSVITGIITRMAGTNNTTFAKFGIQVHTLTIGLALLLIGVAQVAKAILAFNDSTYATFDNGVRTIVEIMGSILGFVLATGVISTLFKTGLEKVTGAFAGFSLLVGAMIGALAVLDLLGRIDMNGLSTAIGHLAILTAFVAGLLVFTGMMDSKTLIGMTGLFIGISLLFATLTGSLWSIALFVGFVEASNISWGPIIGFCVGLSIALVLILGAVSIIAAEGGEIKGAGEAIRAVALVILSLTALITVISFMSDAFGYGPIVAAGILIMYTLGLLVVMLVEIARIKITNAFTTKVFNDIAAIIISLGAVMVALVLIGSFSESGIAAIWSTLIAVGGVLGVLIGVIYAIGDMNKVDKTASTALRSLMGIIIAIGAVMVALSLISAYFDSETSVLVAMLAMSAVLGVLIPLVRSLSTLKDLNKNVAPTLMSLMAVIIALGSVMAAITLISTIGGEQGVAGALVAMAAIAVMCLGLMGIVATLSKLDKDLSKASQTLFTLTWVIIAMGATLAALSLIGAIWGEEGIKSVAVAMAAMLVMCLSLSVVLGVLSKMGKVESLVPVLWSIAAVMLIIGAVLTVLSLISGLVGPDIVLKTALALAAVMIALGVVFAVISNTKVDAGALLGFIGIALAMTLIGGALVFLSSLDTGKMIASAIALSIICLALAGAMAIVGNIDGAKALASAAALGIVMISLVAVMYMLGQIVNTISTDQLLVLGAVVLAIILLTGAVTAAAVALGLLNDACGVIPIVLAAMALNFAAVGLMVALIAQGVHAVIGGIQEFITELAMLSTNSDVDAEKMSQLVSVVGKLGVEFAKVGAGIAVVAGALVLVGIGALAAAVGIVIMSFALVGLGMAATIAAVGIVMLAGAIFLLVLAIVGPFIAAAKFFPEIAEYMMQGFADGLLRGFNGVVDTVTGICKWIFDYVTGFFHIESPSKLFRWIGDMIMSGFIQGLIEKFPALEGVLNGLAETCYELADEIEAAGDTWTAAASIGAQHALDAIQLNFDNFKLDGTNITSQIAGLFGFGAPKATDIIADYRIKDAALAEANAKERWIIEGYASAAEWEEAHKGDSLWSSLFPDMGDIMDDLTSSLNMGADGLDAFGESADGASSSVDNLTSSISNALDVFTEFNATTDLTSKQVLKNFMSQLAGVSTWADELEALAGRGLNREFVAELAEMGPQAYEKIHAMYTMSNKEIGLFNKMYEEKLGLERNTARRIANAVNKNGQVVVDAVAEVGDQSAEAFSNEMVEAAQNVPAVAANEMEQGVLDAHKLGYHFAYVGGVIIPEAIETSLKESTPGVVQAFADLAYSSVEAFEKYLKIEDAMDTVELFQQTVEASITSSLKLFDEVKEQEDISAEEMLKRMKENVKNIGKWANDLQTLSARGISDQLLAELQALGPEGADKVRAFTKMTDAQLQQANQAFAASAALPSQVSNRLTQSYAQAGRDTVLGFVEGVDPEAAEAVMAELGTRSLQSLRDSLDIHSPSRKTEEVGYYTIQGLLLGVNENLPAVEEVGAAIGTTLTSSITVDNDRLAESVALFFTGFGAAMAKGVEDFRYSEAMVFFKQTVLDMLNESVGDMVIEPTIRPVIDMSNANTSRWLQALGNVAVNPSIGRAADASNAAKLAGKDYSADLRDINNTLRQTRDDLAIMRKDIMNLQSSFSDISVTLDGASVGKVITPYVNQNLGQTYVNNKRRSMR